MTIKEIEERSGLARANIRFYEKEGLISPVRQENGYRDYSEKELEELEKIKLLRALDLSVEAIREAKAGKQSLTELLEAHLSYLGVETVRYQAAQKTCQKMCRDGVSYENLQAAQYLHDLHSFPAVKQDQVPRVRSPWRRFFARELDYAIYFSLCYMVILLFVPYTKIQDSVFQKLVLPFLIFLLMFLIEPLLLMKFGTTPGKWILGLRVTNPDDGCLRYSDGLSRMWGVIACGYGFGIPIYQIYRLIRSYLTCCDSEEVLPWEEDSVVVLKDTKSYRAAIYLMVCVLLIGMRVFEGYMQVIPKHRGDLTVQEYAENYNWFSDVSGLDHRLKLEETGDWRTQEDEWGVRKELPDYEYTLDGENVVGISFHLESQKQEEMMPSCDMERIIPILAYVRAKGPVFSFESDKINDMIVKHGYETWEMELYGLTISNEATVEGYEVWPDGNLYPQEGEKQFLELTFSIVENS